MSDWRRTATHYAAVAIMALLVLEYMVGVLPGEWPPALQLTADKGTSDIPRPADNRTQGSDGKWQVAEETPPEPSATPADAVPLGNGTVRRRTRVILLWNTFYGHADFYLGEFGGRPFADCPVSDCVTTADRSAVPRAHALVTHMLDPIMPPLPARRPPHQLYVFFLREPPPITSQVPLSEFNGVFNVTMTYRHDSDVVHPYFNVSPEAEPTPLPAMEDRHRTAVWIVSHCQTSSARELYVEQLQQYMDVDVYGACGPLACNSSQGSDRYRCYQTLASSYHFYMALENSQCRDYVTEKVQLALRYGLVPVVLGPPRSHYHRILPPGSFIHVDDFAGPERLAAHLRYLASNRTAYAEHHRWRQRYHVTDSRGWCTLCEYLHRPHAPQWYGDIERWWRAEAHCALKPAVDVEYYDSK